MRAHANVKLRGTPGRVALLFASLLSMPGCAGVSDETRRQSQGRYELAVNLYRTENQPRSALVELERAVRLDPNNGDAHLLIGQIYGGSGMFSEAEVSLRRAVELLRAEVEEDPSRRAPYGEARNTLGAVLINRGRAAEAVTLLTELTHDVYYPQPHLALSNLGLAYLTLGNYSEAVRVLERAVAQRADFCVGTYRLGEAYTRTGDDNRALASLDRALGAPGSGCNNIQPALRLRGEVNARLHHAEQAQADFTRCRELGADSPDGRACATALRSVEGP